MALSREEPLVPMYMRLGWMISSITPKGQEELGTLLYHLGGQRDICLKDGESCHEERICLDACLPPVGFSSFDKLGQKKKKSSKALKWTKKEEKENQFFFFFLNTPHHSLRFWSPLSYFITQSVVESGERNAFCPVT